MTFLNAPDPVQLAHLCFLKEIAQSFWHVQLKGVVEGSCPAVWRLRDGWMLKIFMPCILPKEASLTLDSTPSVVKEAQNLHLAGGGST